MILYYDDVVTNPTEQLARGIVTADAFYRQMAELSGRRVVVMSAYDPSDPDQFVVGLNRSNPKLHRLAAPILERFGIVPELMVNDELRHVRVGEERTFAKGSVAVIIPSYNYGVFLPEAIESVLRQTVLPDEILLIDDCSNDLSHEIGLGYAERFPKLIRAVRNDMNLGIVKCFNKAVGMVSADYVCFLGADNRFRSDYLERTRAQLDFNPGAAVAYTDYALFGIRARSEYQAFPEERRGPIKHDTFFEIHFPDFSPDRAQELRERNFIHGSSLFRRAVFHEVGEYVDRNDLPEDHGLFWRMIQAGWSAVRVPHALLEYRQHSIEQANTKLSSYRELLSYREELRRLSGELARLKAAQVEPADVPAASDEPSQEVQEQLVHLRLAAASLARALEAQKNSSLKIVERLRAAECESKRFVGELAQQREQNLELRRKIQDLQKELDAQLDAARSVSSELPTEPLVSTDQAEDASRGLVNWLWWRRNPGVPAEPPLPTSIPQYVYGGRVGEEGEMECRVWRGEEFALQPVMLVQGVSVRWSTLTSDELFLSVVGVLMATHLRENTATVVLTVSAGEEVLQEWSIGAEGVVDNQYLVFRGAGIRVPAGTRITFTLSSPNGTQADAVSVWMSMLGELSRSDVRATDVERGFDRRVRWNDRAGAATLTGGQPAQDVVFVAHQRLRILKSTCRDRSISWPKNNFGDPIAGYAVFLDVHEPLELSLFPYDGQLQQIDLGFTGSVLMAQGTVTIEAVASNGGVCEMWSFHAAELTSAGTVSLPVNFGPASYKRLRITLSGNGIPGAIAVIGDFFALDRFDGQAAFKSLFETLRGNALIDDAIHLPQISRYPGLEREIFAPSYSVRFKESAFGSTVTGWDGHAYGKVPFPIVPGRPLEFCLSAEADRLYEVAFSVATFARCNTSLLRIELFEETADGRIPLDQVELSTSEARDNADLVVPIGPVLECRGRLLTVSISSINGDSDNCIAVYGTLIREDSIVYRYLKKGPDHQPLVQNFRRTELDLKPTESLGLMGTAGDKIGRCEHFLFMTMPGSGTVSSEDYAIVRNLRASGHRVETLVFDQIDSLASYREAFDGLILAWPASDPGAQISGEVMSKLQELSRACFSLEIPVVALSSGSAANRWSERLSDFIVSSARGAKGEVWSIRGARASGDSLRVSELLDFVRREYRRQVLPKFSIVSVLYGKEREIPFFLRSIARQTYRGDYEVILVDDCTPDRSSQVARDTWESLTGEMPEETRPRLTILRNPSNRGNCGSRLNGIAAASGDVIVVVDADCLMNADFLAAHAEAHAKGDCDVVVGPLNLESGPGDPIEALLGFESEPLRAHREAELQDRMNLPGFLNCITRNFSIQRSLIDSASPLFDELFAYSKRPDSGFGWEDVEMGYRLYKLGARISYAEKAFSIHVSHPSSVDEGTKPLRSMLNFRRMIEKHPELRFVARRWVYDTFEKICRWADSHGLAENDDRAFLEHTLRGGPPAPLLRTRPQSLRVLTYRWHVPHQFELYKLPHNFSLMRRPGDSFTNFWSYGERPMPENARFVDLHDINERDYDLIVLHFDENSLAPENSNGVLGTDWGHNFKFLKENFSLPMVAVCHGTPQFIGQYCPEYSAPDLGTPFEPERKRLVEYMKDVLVICNSHQAQVEWGFHRSKVIWHGFDPAQFPETSYEKGVLTLGPSMKNRPYYRGYFVLQEILKRLPSEFHPWTTHVDEPSFRYLENSQGYGWAKFRNYVNFLRQFSVYLNPTIRSPMPRARGEAMMCGVIPVCLNNHDVEMFIKNDVNGFYADDPVELADYLSYLLRDARAVRRVGAAARKTAMDIFNHDRYLAAWDRTLTDLVG